MIHRSWLARAAVLAGASSVLLAACAMGAGEGSTSTGGSLTVGSASSSLGTFLTGPNGKTLYIHAGDSMNTSTCTGQCLTAWPPLTAAAGQSVTAGSGVTGHLATFSRSDGSLWVTYNGMPLYYWQGDSKAGDTTGQGVNGFTVALASSSGSGGAASPSASSSSRGY